MSVYAGFCSHGYLVSGHSAGVEGDKEAVADMLADGLTVRLLDRCVLQGCPSCTPDVFKAKTATL